MQKKTYYKDNNREPNSHREPLLVNAHPSLTGDIESKQVGILALYFDNDSIFCVCNQPMLQCQSLC